MIAVSGLTCGYPECSPVTLSNSAALAPNRWRDSIRVGQTMSSCPPEGALGGAKILNRQENIAPAAETEPGRNMGWCLTWTSGHVLTLTKGIAAGHANVAGGQGRLLRAGDVAETGEVARAQTVKDTGVRFIGWHVILWRQCPSPPSSPPLLSWPVLSRLVFSTVIPNQKRLVAEGLLVTWRWKRLEGITLL
jgi:hypothetical protein